MPMSPRLLRPMASGFNPRSVTGLTLWVDAQSIGTFLMNGTGVSRWRDKSGATAGREFAQDTAASQPTVITDFVGSKRAVQVLPNTRKMSLNATWNDLGNNATGEITEYYVLSVPSGIVGAVFSESSGGGHLLYPRWTDDTAYYDSGPSATTRLQASAAATSVATGVIVEARRAGASASLTYGASTLASRSNASGNIYVSVSDAVQFGEGSGGGNAINLAEALIYNRALTTAERSAVKKYLANKYGLTA